MFRRLTNAKCKTQCADKKVLQAERYQIRLLKTEEMQEKQLLYQIKANEQQNSCELETGFFLNRNKNPVAKNISVN
jgi:hypothetical protein